jgi:hypothetical protein
MENEILHEVGVETWENWGAGCIRLIGAYMNAKIRLIYAVFKAISLPLRTNKKKVVSRSMN